MKRLLSTLFLLAAMTAVSAQTSVYDFTVKDQDGKDVRLDTYRGKYLLIVNTATHCGFTPQYSDLQNMYMKFKDDGFVVLDFPCNQFGEQAPGSDREIHTFCTNNYDISFPQFAKIDVNGSNADSLFVWLKSQKGFKGFNTDTPLGKRLHDAFSSQDPNYAESPDIKWNFTKFLIDRNGNVVERFEPTMDMNAVMHYIYTKMYSE